MSDLRHHTTGLLDGAGRQWSTFGLQRRSQSECVHVAHHERIGGAVPGECQAAEYVRAAVVLVAGEEYRQPPEHQPPGLSFLLPDHARGHVHEPGPELQRHRWNGQSSFNAKLLPGCRDQSQDHIEPGDHDQLKQCERPPQCAGRSDPEHSRVRQSDVHRPEALAVINGDPTNPSVADPDFLTTDNSNPDVAAPYGTLPIAVGETYDPTVDGPPEPDPNNADIFSPKIGVPAVFSPKIGTVANSTPAIQTPTVFSPKIFSPKIYSVQVVNPKVVNAIFSPKIFSPKIFSPKIVSPEIFSPKIADLADSTGGATGGSNGGTNPVTDYSWRVSNRGNTSASYSTKEFAKSAGVSCCPASCSSQPSSCTVTADNPAGPNCSVCQLVQHKVYESPTANRESTSGNPTCDLNVQQENIVVANITDPAFTTSTSGTVSAADPTNSTLTLSPGEGNRVTLRVIAPQVSQTVSSFKTRACSFTPDSGQNKSTCSLVIATSAMPVAIVGQSYNTTVMSNGGSGTTFWSVTPDPTNPIALIQPPTVPEPLPVLPLTLSPSGVISSGNSVVSALPATYPINMQVQDSASPPSLDPQQVPMLVNQFTISNVNVVIHNEVGTTAYMKAGDVATVAVTISNQGPATAT